MTSAEKMKTLYHFGVSGGKDSTALLLWACYESGIPLEQIRATFCLVGNESPVTLAYIAMLSAFIFPIEIIQAPLLFYELAEKNHRFPSDQARFCTIELKIVPTRAWIQSQWDKGYELILHSGVRAAESAERAKMATEEFDPAWGCTVRRPLLNWTLRDIWAMHDKYDVPRNPLYDAGASRVGCWPCVMCSKKEIAMIARIDPARIDFIREKEKTIGKRSCGAQFFRSNKVPASQRTQRYECADGRQMKVASIDDVVRWSKTVHGGKQYALGTIDEDAFERDDDKIISCPSAIGQCE